MGDASEPALDEELAWEPDPWTCPVCTLVNDAELPRCGACEALRPRTRPEVGGRAGGNSSGVVVVLPRESEADGVKPSASPHQQTQSGKKREREAEKEGWTCSACTLDNEPGAIRCAACEGLRWVDPTAHRATTAAAIRASRQRPRLAERHHAATTSGGPDAKSHGIWGGLGPDREFLPLPPAPEGSHSSFLSAKDDSLDMFGEAVKAMAAEDSSAPTAESEKVEAETAAKIAEAFEAIEKPEGAAGPFLPQAKEDAAGDGTPLPSRPTWREKGSSLFEVQGSVPLDLLGIDAESMFQDAVSRLALMGFDPMKCHLALEAADGDENVAREILMRQT
eukprot:TRINITY_DN49195_c0_g1_i1.p1 TRINITY_DN49195_c0_g1~~TRINITY_DN49195_c0_g1_i1.p1  ORF type:complete len:336 (+),score=95.10 TRINITY_DN49195_c0_g1_i1:55-1062(+)